MRTPFRVKQKMYYSLPSVGEPIYATDENGNIIYDTMPDGETVPRKVGETPDGYSEPVLFKNSITGDLTADELQAFGAEPRIKCKMTYKKGEFPFVVNTLIWKDTSPYVNARVPRETLLPDEELEPQEYEVDEGTADYRIIGIQDTGRHFYKALLVSNL